MVVKKNGLFFVKMSFLGKIGKHCLCSEGKKKVRIFVATICFWKMVLFWCPFKVTKHYKNRGFHSKKGFYYLWYLKAVLCWKHYFYSVFSKTQLCRHERMQLEQKQKFTKNRGCLPKCKNVFFWYVLFFAFWWFCFLLPVFLSCVL